MKTKRQKQKGHVTNWIDAYPEVFNPNFADTPYERLMVKKITSKGVDNLKTVKNDYTSCGVAMAPHRTAGAGNLCTDASPFCIITCLNETGNGAIFPRIQAARQNKSILFQTERRWFLKQLDLELRRWEMTAEREESTLAARLNMFSDVRWENYLDLASYDNSMFYDYTKHPDRVGWIADNYYTTFSRSETNEEIALDLLSQALNVAVVFWDNLHPRMGRYSQFQRLPKTWKGFKVYDGDQSDARFDDPVGRKHGRVIGLRLKASSWDKYYKAVKSGFAVPSYKV